METGCPIHYHGNTVIGPHPSEKNRAKRAAGVANGIVAQSKIMDFEVKVCASSQCAFCGMAFPEWSVVCQFCRSCQYCGLISHSKVACRLCGNHLPDELAKTNDRKTVRLG